jgi:4,5-dihydroxyphthalate decarboxylase
MFWRQLKFADFDVSELSFSSLSMAKARGDDRYVGLPIFTTRHFFQNWILVRKGARIDSPEDMKGKRVGVPEYQQTAAVWSRGILQHDFGVKPSDMVFFMERAPAQSHGGSTGFQPPPGVTIHGIPQEKNIGSMMLSGELDATLLYFVDKNLIDRSRAAFSRPGRGRQALLHEERPLPDQSRHGRAQIDHRSSPLGDAQPVQGVRACERARQRAAPRARRIPPRRRSHLA